MIVVVTQICQTEKKKSKMELDDRYIEQKQIILMDIEEKEGTRREKKSQILDRCTTKSMRKMICSNEFLIN